MPLEVKSRDDLLKYNEHATECTVVYGKDTAKIKLRTKKTLVVLKATPEEVKEITKHVKAPITEIGTKPEKE